MNRRIDTMLGPGIFNTRGWHRLLEKHGGVVPVRIKAIPEGTVLNASNALLVVENTDEEFPWVTNFVETLLMKTWYPLTVASAQYAKYQMFLGFLVRTGTPRLIDYKWVDFGYRGVSSEESAALGGAAHVLSFRSSETPIADEFIEAYYGGKECQTGSVPAAEHSTVTSWGRDHEVDAYRNMLRQYPTGIVSVVSDSYDYENAVKEIWGTQLRDEVLARDGVVVVRPDSGDPASIVLRSCQWLGEKFGYEEEREGLQST